MSPSPATVNAGYKVAICRAEARPSGRDNGSYRIDQGKCIKCDAGREQARYAIAVVDESA